MRFPRLTRRTRRTMRRYWASFKDESAIIHEAAMDWLGSEGADDTLTLLASVTAALLVGGLLGLVVLPALLEVI